MSRYLLIYLLLFYLTSVCATNPIGKYSSTNNGFIENKGQIIDQNNKPNKEVLYMYCRRGFHVQLKGNGFSYELLKIPDMPKPKLFGMPNKEEDISQPVSDTTYTHRIDITFANGNTNCEIIRSETSSDYNNYYTTGTPEEGIANVHQYKKVLYKNIYPNIDIEFLINDPSLTEPSRSSEVLSSNFKYNIIVHPGGNPNDIQLKIDGANKTSINKEANILIETSLGNIEEQIPYSYQLSNDNKKLSITTNFEQRTTNCFGIGIDNYNPSQTLIIDPMPWATYYGGTGNDVGTSIVTDANGNIFLTGYTNSSTNIATIGSYQSAYSWAYDVFFVKLNQSGTVQWATYAGGSNDDYALSIAKDLNGNFFISGNTTSDNGIATIGSYQTLRSGNSDAFIINFNSTGYRVWGTYYGGISIEKCNGISVDKLGDILITGSTSSTSGIATTGAHRTNIYYYVTGGYYNYPGNIFVAKFNNSGTSLLWGTYYGGHGWGGDKGIAITTDTLNNVLVTGVTEADTGIATSGAYQTTIPYHNIGSAFIVKFNPNGTRLWGTYYGGPDDDTYGNAIVTDDSGNVFLAGLGPLTLYGTQNAYQPFNGSSGISQGNDAFVAKFNSIGTNRIWGTFYGGTGTDYANGIALDPFGNIIITGNTSSSSAIASAGAYQNSLGGSTSTYDAFIAKLDPTGTSRLWGTYLGGAGDDYGASIATFNSDIFVLGQTASTAGIATSGAYQTSFGGSTDAFIAAFTNNGSLPVTWLNLSAKLQDNKTIQLNWQTASEINNDYFSIERTTDIGKEEDWQKIGIVKGNGNTNALRNYQFTDVNGASTSLSNHSSIYYRLKQVDYDGHFDYSKIVSVNLDKVPNDEIRIYPNPASESITLQITETAAEYSIYNSMGLFISAGSMASSADISLLNMASGMYIIQLKSPQGNYIGNVKFVKK